MTVDPNCIDLPAFVADGASVTTGHQIAEVGDLGNASGCHHFELHSNAASIYQVPADPTIWLRESVGNTSPASRAPAIESDRRNRPGGGSEETVFASSGGSEHGGSVGVCSRVGIGHGSR